VSNSQDRDSLFVYREQNAIPATPPSINQLSQLRSRKAGPEDARTPPRLLSQAVESSHQTRIPAVGGMRGPLFDPFVGVVDIDEGSFGDSI
jgi:hypothetical protein